MIRQKTCHKLFGTITVHVEQRLLGWRIRKPQSVRKKAVSFDSRFLTTFEQPVRVGGRSINNVAGVEFRQQRNVVLLDVFWICVFFFDFVITEGD